MDILTIPRQLFQQILQRLHAPGRLPVFTRLSRAGKREWLVGDIVVQPALASNEPGTSLLRIVTMTDVPTTPRLWPEPVAAHLYLGDGWLQGHWIGFAHDAGRAVALQELRLVGSGMHRIPASDMPPHVPAHLTQPTPPIERWSRTIGALGNVEVWQRLTRLSIGIAGCGRSGSMLALALARLGVEKLLLIDADMVELHNLGEMALVNEDDIGHPKVFALAHHLAKLAPVRIQPMIEPCSAPEALDALRGCDVVVCCADQEDARLAAALVATLYHRVLLDIGTDIQRPISASPQLNVDFPRLGADVRLITPGDGCLLCRGNLPHYADAVRTLRDSAPARPSGTGWRTQRAGSLASLNQLAVAVGVRMLEDLVAERIAGSCWAQLEYVADGRLQVSYPTLPDIPSCPLCARAGFGDASLGAAGHTE